MNKLTDQDKAFGMLGVLTLGNCWLASAMIFEYLTVPVGMGIVAAWSGVCCYVGMRVLMGNEKPWRRPSQKG